MTTRKIICVPQVTNPKLLRAKISFAQTRARLAVKKEDPASKAWAEVMDALWDAVKDGEGKNP